MMRYGLRLIELLQAFPESGHQGDARSRADAKIIIWDLRARLV